MDYRKIRSSQFFQKINSEEKARQWLWRARCGGKDFVCIKCKGESYWQHHGRPEIRHCRSCHYRMRLRAGTIFEHSKTSLLNWVRAVYWAMTSKRGISALELQRQLKMPSYGTVWTMLHKIREALRQRDQHYTLRSFIELDGAHFGRRETGNQIGVLVAIETKEFIDEKGNKKERAGFAKVVVAEETKENAAKFVEENIERGSFLNTDASRKLRDIPNVHSDYQKTDANHMILERWLPWVFRFVENAKSWILGTHHGVEKAHLHRYLAEYTYRFNRRHDPNGLFHRALTACATAQPKTSGALFG